jgi:hypothetical protein
MGSWRSVKERIACQDEFPYEEPTQRIKSVYLFYSTIKHVDANEPPPKLEGIFLSPIHATGYARLWVAHKNYELYGANSDFPDPAYEAATGGLCIKTTTPPFKDANTIVTGWTVKVDLLYPFIFPQTFL